MSKQSNSKPAYDLEERNYQLAKKVRLMIKQLPKTIANLEDTKQVIRSSGSIGANYIEANESLGKKDFLMRVKMSRKEAKESVFFLKLINETNEFDFHEELENLIDEADQLKKIMSAIIEKSK